MKLYILTEDGVDGVYAVCLRKEDAERMCEENVWLTVSEEVLNTGGEPIFVLRGQDKMSSFGVVGYLDALTRADQPVQAHQVTLALGELYQWQRDNEDRTKFPDHPHEPAIGGEGSSS